MLTRRNSKNEESNPFLSRHWADLAGVLFLCSRIGDRLRGHAFVALGFQRTTANHNQVTKSNIVSTEQRKGSHHNKIRARSFQGENRKRPKSKGKGRKSNTSAITYERSWELFLAKC